MQNSFVATSVGVVFTFVSFLSVSSANGQEPKLLEEVAAFVEIRASEFDQIPAERKKQLGQLANYLRESQSSGKSARLVFVCTHNSRRSHMSQLWAAVAAVHYGLENVETFSGGTECTAFNPRAVSALKRAGFHIELEKAGTNPNYIVTFANHAKPQICFSKVYSDTVNPDSDFCAIMTCTSADKNCPTVPGAVKRIAIPFEDPKVADGTPEEASKYDERSAQICREILYAFSLASQPASQ
jgi:arsenate reductase